MRYGRSLLLVGLSCATLGAAHNLTVYAYLPEWRYEGANWVDYAAVVTHLILFSLEVQPTGRLAAFDRLPRKELMSEARAATKVAGTKLLVCIGGNGRSAGFTHAVANKERRERFVESLASLADKYDLDGVDLNWEYPGYDFKSGYASDDVLNRECVRSDPPQPRLAPRHGVTRRGPLLREAAASPRLPVYPAATRAYLGCSSCSTPPLHPRAAPSPSHTTRTGSRRA